MRGPIPKAEAVTKIDATHTAHMSQVFQISTPDLFLSNMRSILCEQRSFLGIVKYKLPYRYQQDYLSR